MAFGSRFELKLINSEFVVLIFCISSHNWESGLTSLIQLTFPSSGIIASPHLKLHSCLFLVNKTVLETWRFDVSGFLKVLAFISPKGQSLSMATPPSEPLELQQSMRSAIGRNDRIPMSSVSYMIQIQILPARLRLSPEH